MIRGGGDPNTAMALKPCPEWARRLGASPQKRIVASWSGSRMDPTEYKVAARASRPSVGSPRINCTEPRTMKDIELQKHLTRADKALECLAQGRVWNVTLVLVDLPGRE